MNIPLVSSFKTTALKINKQLLLLLQYFYFEELQVSTTGIYSKRHFSFPNTSQWTYSVPEFHMSY